MPALTVLGFDTATAATVAGLTFNGQSFERRDDPAVGARPGHATRLLSLIEDLFKDGGVGWKDIDRVAIGVGPGSFTGLRIGVATARALAQARGLPIAPVSTLRALAAGALEGISPIEGISLRPVAAIIDARRGEIFAGVWEGEATLLAPQAVAPDDFCQTLRQLGCEPTAVGDGAVRYRSMLEAAGALIAADEASEHRVSGPAICELGARGDLVSLDKVIPNYLRQPDAEISLKS